MILTIVSVGAIVHSCVPVRRLLPTTKILASFPAQIGTYSARQQHFLGEEAIRQAYAPAEVLYRDYASSDGVSINLFIAPEPVGWHTPSACAAYQGYAITGFAITELSLLPTLGAPKLMLNELVLRSGLAGDALRVCAYYWRTPSGPVNESGFNLLMGRLAALGGRMSFRVYMCTDIKDISEISAAFERLSKFAQVIDPEVRKLLNQATVSPHP
jgi:hypothetical protein